MNLTVYVESLGCSKNLIDAEIMLGILNKYGYKLTSNKKNADAIIVNTCGFIESAKEESINKIIEIGLLKQDRLKVLIVSGCLGERYHKELIEELPEVDAVVGTGGYDAILDVIHEALQGNRVVQVGNIDKAFNEDLPRFQTTPSYTSYIKISDGCDNFCTYCIIPKLRGKYRSRKMESIVKEAKELASRGVKEVILIAQDTARYGIDLYDQYMLPQLLKELNAVEGLEWIRLLYAYPEMISDELIQTMATLEKVCHYLDMPIQHCSNEVLKRMNRRTTKDALETLINKLRNNMPDISLRTSLIVGFPGETEENFQELKKFVEDMKFDKLGVFEYSVEEGTPAAKLADQIEESIKVERRNEIMELQQQISLGKNQEKIGGVVKVLIEEDLDQDREYMGRTEGDAPEIDGLVYVQSNTTLKEGDLITVRITGALEYDLMGEKVDEFSK
ncbi:30S ribosomal protein S12 methylthiotransferase RimO [Alkaliphilus hydrothermalis]|uniref:Ribosomal protein uS12 methylthiotransferase RimO n=1 Tax=Alkaliphilus hydrothermalis TaxID=1482730 RepID=A0ABS2NLL4_9FIRM|nr:30S ribosomal protein S12 methylthiotransferase RimO [Alkaliphilus hydrothermalis]MBM7613727.1 ribosomal protein S12 methylthiotransferase [Alkaliphilus hydrothermalis]